MNKKYLSALLFGALTLASTGTFTSCKDYDDDIENLQAQLDAQKSDLTTQLSALDAALKNAESNIAKAQQAADAAKAEAAAAKTEAEKATAAAKEAAAKAQEAAATAKKEAIEEATKLVNDLKAQVDGKVDVEVYDAAVKELAGKIAAIEEGLNKISNLPNENAKAIEQLKIQMEAVEAYKSLIDKKADASEIERIDAVVKAIEEKINNLVPGTGAEVDLTEIKNLLDATAKSVESINADLVTILRQDLRSLVFMPELYVDGIESTEYAYGFATYINGDFSENDLNTIDDKKTPSKILKGQVYAYNGLTSTGMEWYENPAMELQYHLNPSSAKVTAEQLSFISRDVESINSRANNANDSEAKPVVAGASVKDGILTVSYEALGGRIAREEGMISTMALQANVKINGGQKDTTITSDYVRLYPSMITPKNIGYSQKSVEANDCSEQPKSDHIYMSAQEALLNPATLSVEYNGSLELSEYLNIHYNQSNKEDLKLNDTKSAGVHKIWKYGEEAKYDLEYRYSLLEYSTGSFEGEETQTQVHKYGFVNEKGHFEPRFVDKDGNSLASTGASGISAVGKKPIVRVEVVDKTTGQVLLGGFVKIAIVRTIKPIVSTPFEMDKQGFACNALVSNLTWAEMSSQLLELTALTSKAEFEQLYELEATTHVEGYLGTTRDFFAKTYVMDENGNIVPNKNIPAFIYELGNVQGNANDFLVWETYQHERELYYAAKEHKVTVYVAYKVKNTVSESSVAKIYVPLTLEIVKPEATYGKKIKEYWYEDLKTQRVNVNYPANGGNTENYVGILDNAFYKNNVEFTLTNNENGLFDDNWLIFDEDHKLVGTQTVYRYYFTDNNNGREYTVGNSTYVLKVDEYSKINQKYGTALVAYDKKKPTDVQLIARFDYMNNPHGNMIYAGRSAEDVNNSEISKILLNAWSHDAETSYFAHVGIVASNASCEELVLGEYEFDARFLRPLDVKGAEKATFKDAEANGSTIEVYKLLQFEDWRNVKITGKDQWLLAFYDVKAIRINTADVTTNLDGNDIATTKLSSISKNISLHFYNESNEEVNEIKFDLSAYNNSTKSSQVLEFIKKKFGHITYTNNGNNVKKFSVRIPIAVTYEWGTVNTHVDCVVEPTQGNESEK